MRQIFRAEGMAGLYTGLAPSLIMAVPSTMLYFTLYDELFSTLRTLHSRKLDPFAPMIAGATARLCAATTIAPFELVRTQLQSLSASEQVSIARMFRRNIRATGIRSLWNGIGPTLWRDVPFSALYWGAYQNLRVWLGHNERLARSPLLASFIAGATAGMCAAVATHPFDVVKTQRQVIALARPQHNDLGTLNALRAILRDEGPSGLFRGVVPRVVKVAPACAIMIATYEAGKAAFTSQLPHHEQSLR
jgi:solute carrier family 25 protein 39/40